jgi:transglutaminase-like putative cysteine protease
MAVLPHPLAPEQRLVGTRDLAWLLASLALVVTPHALRAPLWLTGLTLCLYGWRVYFTLNRAPLPSRWLLIGVAVVGMIGIWMEGRTLFGRSSGIMLLLLFSGLKLLETRTHRDAAVAVFLGYFLIITNFLSTQSIPTAAAMGVGLFMLTASLVGLSAPQRAIRANLRTAGVLLLHGAPAALVLFLLFPRVQGPLWGLPQDAHTGVSGLSSTMTPGDLSRLVLSDAIAFRAEFEGEPPPHRQLYWRGPVLWNFDGRAWRPGWPVPTEHRPVDGGGPRYRYSVIIEPHQFDWLFALESPATLPERARFTPDGTVVGTGPVRNRLRYELTSFAVAQVKPDEDPSALRRAVLLPAHSNPRARALGAEWRAAGDSHAKIVERAIAHLRAGRFTYTLEPPLLGEHSVDEFLFTTKEGFCEHFASAFVFLMRSAGVPARVVMGYQGGETNTIDRIVTVRQSDAHAWAEVFLAERGWVRIDPTAASNPQRVDSGIARAVQDAAPLPFLTRTDLEWLRGLRHRWDALAHKWNVWVLGYSPERQRDLLQFVGIPDADWRELTATLFTVLGIITAGLLVWSLRRFARPDPVQAAWRAFCRKLATQGLERAPHEGPRDYSSRAARALPGSRRAILRIGALYIRLRYGAGPPAALRRSVQELRRLVRELRFS